MSDLSIVIDRDRYPERLRQGREGYAGSRVWCVRLEGGGDATGALLHPGLPALGTPWDDRLPACTLRTRGPAEHEGGEWWRVPLEYAEPGAEGGSIRRVPETANDKWADLTFEEQAETVYYGVDEAGNAVDGPPINNGSGVAISAAAPVLRVTRHLPLTAGQQFSALLAKCVTLSRPPKVNAAPVTVPALYKAGAGFEVPARQLLYAGVDRVDVVGGFIQVVHRLRWAELWDYFWPQTNDRSEIVLVRQERLYGDGDFEGLW